MNPGMKRYLVENRLQMFLHQSECLRGNPWNDPVERAVWVWLPPGWEQQKPPLPALWDLAAYTSSGAAHVGWKNFGENLPDRLDRLFAQGSLPPAAVVMPDCFTRLGGNQYVNSPALGSWADYLQQELIPFVESRLPIGGSRENRAVFGKSSGGYGALRLAMLSPEYWGAAAVHAGDCDFELVYRPDFPKVAQTLERYNGDWRAFLEDFWSRSQPSGSDIHTLMVLCLAASYDPDEARPDNLRLPFDLHTLELIPERWQAWLAHDPLELLNRYGQNLSQLKGLWIDVGRHDQYNIQYGSRKLHRKLETMGIAHIYEEFDGTHSGIDYRLDHSLPYLVHALNT